MITREMVDFGGRPLVNAVITSMFAQYESEVRLQWATRCAQQA